MFRKLRERRESVALCDLPPSDDRRKQLWLVRHGDFNANRAGMLTSGGELDAHRAGRMLVAHSFEQPGLIIASPHLRTRQTAEIAAAVIRQQTGHCVQVITSEKLNGGTSLIKLERPQRDQQIAALAEAACREAHTDLSYVRHIAFVTHLPLISKYLRSTDQPSAVGLGEVVRFIPDPSVSELQ